jgi:hypothetical protein
VGNTGRAGQWPLVSGFLGQFVIGHQCPLARRLALAYGTIKSRFVKLRLVQSLSVTRPFDAAVVTKSPATEATVWASQSSPIPVRSTWQPAGQR